MWMKLLYVSSPSATTWKYPHIDPAGAKHLSNHSRDPSSLFLSSRATIESIAWHARRVYGSDSLEGPLELETLWLPWPACHEQCVLEKEGECQFWP